ncbi:MAG: hypothetical protein JJE39_12685 [Vicinamibacteria bacterium]|nr:hypothetical protein [Vicinamibacteria bacterium]
MRSPAIAIAWEFGQRVRLGMMVLFVYMLVVGTIMLVRFKMGQPVSLGDVGKMVALVVGPVAMTFMYFLGVFSFGFASDLAARESTYPARMFTLPVTTRALAGWPMFYGASAMTVLFLAGEFFLRWEPAGILGRFVVREWGFDGPLMIWPPLLAAVFLAWTQALTWMAYGWRGLRVIVTVLCLISLDASVFVATQYKIPDLVLVAFLLPQLPLAYLAACFAISRARRGDVPDWRGMPARLSRISDVFRRQRDHFPSAARAQMWFEWRQHGRSLPVWVAILLPFELALLFLARDEPEAMTFFTVFGVLLTPPLMAGFVAATVSRSNTSGRDAYGVPPFTATRPLTSAALIAAKLKVTLLSTLATWLLVLVALLLGLALSGTLSVVIQRVNEGIEFFGRSRTVVSMLLGLLALMASTWKRLVHSLFLDLSGREWLIKSSVLLALSLLVIIWPIGRWIHDDRNVLTALLNALPLVLAVLVCVKMSAAAWIATRLYDGRLVSDRTLVTGVAAWLVAVLALFGLFTWFWSTPHVAHYFLLLIAILEIPLARLSAAPLALAWNRHR